MEICKNCNCKIRKKNGVYFHIITPTGRSNGVTSHFTDLACRCDEPEPKEDSA